MRDAAGDIYVRQRPPKGLLAKMTEVPGSAWGPKADPSHPVPGQWRHAGQVVHVFTHFRLELEVWTATVSPDSSFASGWWASPDSLDEEALPSLYRKVLALALGRD
jgi:A/G-specific adenine glycosylase